MSKTKGGLKIAFIDLETSPNLGYTWGKWEQDVIEFEKEWHLLSFSYKWIDDKKVHTFGLPDFKMYKNDPENDYDLVAKLWELFDEADVLVAHNGDQFDIKKANARFIYHGFTPPSPYKTIDTKKIAKKYFSFNTNKLNDISQHLGIGEKVKTGGFELWKGCMSGDKKSWATMLEYNAQDVVLLEEVYYAMRSWMTNHPNTNLLLGTTHNCPVCNGETHKRGFNISKVGKTQRYQCTKCAAWSSGETIKEEDKVVVR